MKRGSYATNVDLDELLRIRKGRTGDHLWFVRGGRAYLVTDPAVLAAGRDILLPVRALSREQEAVSARLRPLEIEAEERRLEDREREVEAVADAQVARLIEDALRRGLARAVR